MAFQPPTKKDVMLRLILCDMDLTLVPFGQQAVTPLALQAIHELLDLGIYVGASSGRGIPDLRRQFAGDEACVRTAVASNGCQVMADGQLICHNPLPREELEEALQVVRDVPGAFFTSDIDGTRAAIGESAEVVNRRFANWKGARFFVTDHFPEGDLVKVNLTFDEGLADAREVVAMISPLCPSIDFCILDGHVADMMPAGWDKARGAQALLDHFGFGPDELLVFGDSENDLSLFRAFPEASVAVANAIPEARQAARWHIGPCTEDACAKALLELASAIREGRDPRWMDADEDARALERALTDPGISAAHLHELWTRPRTTA